MKTYVVTVYYGDYEDKGTAVLYAGNSHDTAYTMARDSQSFPKEWRGSEIQTWENGKMIKDEDVL